MWGEFSWKFRPSKNGVLTVTPTEHAQLIQVLFQANSKLRSNFSLKHFYTHIMKAAKYLGELKINNNKRGSVCDFT